MSINRRSFFKYLFGTAGVAAIAMLPIPREPQVIERIVEKRGRIVCGPRATMGDLHFENIDVIGVGANGIKLTSGTVNFGGGRITYDSRKSMLGDWELRDGVKTLVTNGVFVPDSIV